MEKLNYRLVHSLNFVLLDSHGEYNDEASMTQPDEVLSIREMLVRHARGIAPSSPYGEGTYYPEEMGFIPSIKEMDLSEIDDARQALNKRVKDIKAKFEKQNKDQPNLPRGERPPEGQRSEKEEKTDTPVTETTQKTTVSEGEK